MIGAYLANKLLMYVVLSIIATVGGCAFTKHYYDKGYEKGHKVGHAKGLKDGEEKVYKELEAKQKEGIKQSKDLELTYKQKNKYRLENDAGQDSPATILENNFLSTDKNGNTKEK